MVTIQLSIGTGCQILFSLIIACTAAFYDYRRFKIPNALTYSSMLLGVAWHVFSPYGQGGVTSFGGLAFGFLSLIPFFIVGGMGAGDVKLMMAIGAILGFKPTLIIFLASALTTGVYSVYLMISRSCFAITLDRLRLICQRFIIFGQHLAMDDHHRTEVGNSPSASSATLIPFGVMVALGMVIIYGLAISSKVL